MALAPANDMFLGLDSPVLLESKIERTHVLFYQQLSPHTPDSIRFATDEESCTRQICDQPADRPSRHRVASMGFVATELSYNNAKLFSVKITHVGCRFSGGIGRIYHEVATQVSLWWNGPHLA